MSYNLNNFCNIYIQSFKSLPIVPVHQKGHTSLRS